jgi:hypothetical protein
MNPTAAWLCRPSNAGSLRLRLALAVLNRSAISISGGLLAIDDWNRPSLLRGWRRFEAAALPDRERWIFREARVVLGAFAKPEE